MVIRKIATPLTIGSFITVGATGAAMLLGYRPGFVGLAHKISSVAFLVGAVLHVWVNWRPTTAHLRKPLPRFLALVFLLAALGALLPLGGRPSPRAGMFQAAQLILDQDLDGLARLTHQPRPQLQGTLERAGFTIPQADASLRAIAQASHKEGLEAVAVLLTGRGGGR